LNVREGLNPFTSGSGSAAGGSVVDKQLSRLAKTETTRPVWALTSVSMSTGSRAPCWA
jgi:hypothetical protein